MFKCRQAVVCRGAEFDLFLTRHHVLLPRYMFESPLQSLKHSHQYPLFLLDLFPQIAIRVSEEGRKKSSAHRPADSFKVSQSWSRFLILYFLYKKQKVRRRQKLASSTVHGSCNVSHEIGVCNQRSGQFC